MLGMQNQCIIQIGSVIDGRMTGWWKEDVNKEETHWFKFQEAVKEHQAVALGPVNEKCKAMGIDIRLL